ncbi:hypothetical protein L1987_13591 [Smallanthus sonchifolius]|uniref:Uncharacterized protein n=1 Tax=Smallanthus sonchifolius TaxID=185202 RepID=A0ACB9JGW1_9ASTR|nr:hypothetical protein L1987_13591 [Smallanthus sonchifolius]
MKKSHSRSTFSGVETPLFPEMLGLSDGESEVFSSFSSDSDCESDSKDDAANSIEGKVHEEENVDFEHEELRTTLGTTSPPPTPVEERVPTPNHNSPPAQSEEMSIWDITLQNHNQALQQAVKEKLKYSESSSKPRKFKRLVKGPHPNPSYKNFRVSSSSSSSDSAIRQGEKGSENEIHVANHVDNAEINDAEIHNADVHPSSPDVVVNSSKPIINSPIGYPTRNIDKGKGILIEEESEEPSKFNLSKKKKKSYQ